MNRLLIELNVDKEPYIKKYPIESNINFNKQNNNTTYQYHDTSNNSVEEVDNSTWDNK